MAETETKSAESTRGRPKTRIGIVTSNKMSKTVVVTVRRRAAHAQYGKVMSMREKYKAHAEDHDPKKPTINEGGQSPHRRDEARVEGQALACREGPREGSDRLISFSVSNRARKEQS